MSTPSPPARRRAWLGATVSIVTLVVGAALGVVAAANWPSIDDWLRQTAAADSRVLTAADWTPVQTTAVTVDSDGGLTVASPRGNMRWFGIYVANVGPCAWRLDLDAEMVEPADGGQHGYAIGPGVNVDGGGIPHGRAFQYDAAFRGIREPEFEHDSEDDASGYIQVQQSSVDGTPVLIDNRPHHWTIDLRGTTAQAHLDGHSLLPIAVRTSCSRSLYLRVWNGSARFRNVTVTKI